jgi:uncharacterized protein (TIGR00369 family)
MSVADSGIDPAFLAPSTDDWDAWPDWATRLPASVSMGLRGVSVSPQRTVLTMAESAWPLNPNGAVHGGLVAAGADQAGGVAAIASLGAGALPATATLHGQFLRPAFPGLTYECRLIKGGTQLVFVEIDVFDRDGRHCARFDGTWSVHGAVPRRRTVVDDA